MNGAEVEDITAVLHVESVKYDTIMIGMVVFAAESEDDSNSVDKAISVVAVLRRFDSAESTNGTRTSPQSKAIDRIVNVLPTTSFNEASKPVSPTPSTLDALF